MNQHTALPPWKCESGLAECPGCAAVGEDMMSLDEMVAGRKDKGFERVINSDGCDETLVRTRALCCGDSVQTHCRLFPVWVVLL